MAFKRKREITLSEFIQELQKHEEQYGDKPLISIGSDTRGYFCPRVQLNDQHKTESFNVPQYIEG